MKDVDNIAFTIDDIGYYNNQYQVNVTHFTNLICTDGPYFGCQSTHSSAIAEQSKMYSINVYSELYVMNFVTWGYR
jgi:hypothetical protein